MARPRLDVTQFINQQFGYLTVTSAWRDHVGVPYVHVECSCGEEREYKLYWLTRTKEPYRSCGCKKEEAYERYSDDQIERLDFHMQVAVWDAAQEEGAKVGDVANAYQITKAAARAIIGGMQDRVREFVGEIDNEGWFELALRTRSLMRERGVDTFRFGKKPGSPADHKFMKRVVEPAFDLFARYGDFTICHSEPVKRRFAVVEWMCQTYRSSVITKRRRRAKAAEAAAGGNAWSRRTGPTPENQAWRAIYGQLGVSRRRKPS